MKTAVIIGSTGLVGSALLEKLLKDSSYSQVITIVRSNQPADNQLYSHPKNRSLVFSFQNWGELELQISSFSGNSSCNFFCCLGTTIGKAGSEEAFKKVDFGYVVEFAKLAQKCRAEQLFVVSALGADKNSLNFYTKTKGETEEAVQTAFSGKLHFLRPSLLLGDRKEFRLSERLAILASPLYSPLLKGPLEKFKPVKASDVASAMLNISLKKSNASTIVSNDEIIRIAHS